MGKFHKLTSLTRKIKRVYHNLMDLKPTVYTSVNLLGKFKKPLPLLILIILVLPVLIAVSINLKPFLEQKIFAPGQKTLGCPVSKEACLQAAALEVITTDSKKINTGLGWKLATGSAVIAVFDGTLKVQPTFGGKRPPRLYLLTNPTNTYRADYLFITEKPFAPNELEVLTTGKKVKKGEIIATVPGITLDDMGYRNLNLLFYLVNLKTKQRISNLSSQSFGSLSLP